jgi:hypothetical protein
MGEVSRYSDLSVEKEADAQRYAQELAVIAEEHEVEIANLLDAQELELQAEKERYAEMEAEMAQQ